MDTTASARLFPKRLFLSTLALVLAAALGGGCGGSAGGSAAGGSGGSPGGGDGGGGPGGTPTTVEVHGRVALGALANATLSVYRVGQYAAPLATTTTSTGATAADIGRFTVTLDAVPAGALYLFVATGGEAHDANEDGVLDGPTPNQGTVHALASAAQLTGREVRLSAITEVVYQRVRAILEGRYDDAYLVQAASAWTSFVLRASIAGNGAIDGDDALAFDPLVNASATFRPYAAHYVPIVGRILSGQPLTAAAFDRSREELAYLDLPGRSWGVTLAGTIAYLCRGTDGLDLWSVADPTTPVFLARFDTPGYAAQVQVVGSLAFVADDTGGLAIVDVSTPTAPTLVRRVPTTGPVSDVCVAGNRAYLADRSGSPRLYVVDVTTPASASVLAAFPTLDAPSAVRVAGNFAYLLEPGQIETVNVSDPANPASAGTVPVDAYAYMDLAAGHLFVASAGRLEVLSLAAPQTPLSVASVAVEGYSSGGIRVRGSTAVLGRSFDGVCLVDVADPTHPAVRGLLPTSGSAVQVDGDEHLVVASEGNSGLIVAAAGTPAPSAVVARVALPGVATAVESVGDRTYVATSAPNELVVFDTTNPLAPTVLGRVPLVGGGAHDILINGGRAYVAEGNGLEVYDVSNPAAPTNSGGNTGRGELVSLALHGDLLYASASTYLLTYDVSIPDLPLLVTVRTISGTGGGVAVDGNALVLAANFAGVTTFDATNPRSPAPVGSLAAAQAIDVSFRAPFAFVSIFGSTGADDRLLVVDTTNLAAPASSHAVLLPGTAERLDRSGDRLYVSARVAGVHVVDVASPNAAFLTGTLPVPSGIEDLSVAGGWLYLADGYPGGALLVLRAAQVAVP